MKINGNGTIKLCFIAALLVLSATFVHAQVPARVEPTSATDSDVKIHRKLSIFGHSKNSRKIKGQAHSTERAGRSLPKKQTGRGQFFGKEASVFKKHFAKREVNLRKKTRVMRKQSLTRSSIF